MGSRELEAGAAASQVRVMVWPAVRAMGSGDRGGGEGWGVCDYAVVCVCVQNVEKAHSLLTGGAERKSSCMKGRLRSAR
jgi:hypothetical protein